MAFRRRLLLIIFFATLAFLVRDTHAECTSVCKCSGYKAADCTDKGLIMIPDGIDGETLSLNMTGNNLQMLSHDTFRKIGLVNLQHLHLTSCRLGQIDDHAFRGLTNLITLYLNHNLLTAVPSHTFANVPNLKLLDLSRNPIQKLDPYTFRLLPNLSHLYVTNCNLQWIGPRAFEGLDSLAELSLNDNQLASLPAGSMMNTLHRLKMIQLHGNPWKCDCNLRATKVWLADKSLVPIYCHGGPERVRNQPVLELSTDDFACMPQIKADSRQAEAVVGSNTSVECRVESDPVAKISWYRNGVSLSNYSLFNSNSKTYISQTGENIYDMRSKLIITNVEPGDGGQYKCVAENKAGRDETYFTVNTVAASVRMSFFDSGRLNTLTIAFAVLIVFMLIVIVLLVRMVRRRRALSSSTNSVSSIEKSPPKTTVLSSPSSGAAAAGFNRNNPNYQRGGNVNNNNNTNNVRSNSSEDTSSNNTEHSRDSVYKSESGKAFTITSDLSYSRSLSDIGNPPQFSNPDLIMHHGNNTGVVNAAAGHRIPSSCDTPLGRPTSDYSQNWQRSYDLPRIGGGTPNTIGYGYETMDPRFVPVLAGDTTSAGSITDEVFATTPGSRISSDYPSDYGLPILPENGTLPQPCAKTLKVWQKGVPVYPPMYSTLQNHHHHQQQQHYQQQHHPQQPQQHHPHYPAHLSSTRNSPADPRCGTDV